MRSAGPVVELGVGTGRIAVPIARRRASAVIGVDSSQGMLEVAARAGRARGRRPLDLRFGDMREPPVEREFPLVICPFRSLLHMETDADRRAALRAVRALLEPGGRFVFDVFTPGADDIAETHGRWLEREPGILERADWDEDARTLVLRVRGDGARRRCRSRGSSVGRVARAAGATRASSSRRSTAGSTARPGGRRGLDLGLRRARRSAALVERDRAGRRDVQRLRAGERDRRVDVASKVGGRPSRSAPSRNATRSVSGTAPSGTPPCATSATCTAPAHVVERPERDAPDRAGARAQGLRRRRVGAAVGQRDGGGERVGGADQRADVARIGESPERSVAGRSSQAGRSLRR